MEFCFDQVNEKLSLFTQQQMGTRLSSEQGKVEAMEEMDTNF